MKAARFHRYGDPEVLLLEDVPTPRPGAGEVLIAVAATSFNLLDAALRSGAFKEIFPLEFPSTPGLDVAGTITALGEGVDAFAVGDAVIGYLPSTAPGAAAEFVLAPVDVLAHAPASVPLADAAALPLVGLTAWQALFEHGEYVAGQRVLINGAGGAVGGYATQLAVTAGAHVIATASTDSAQRVASYRPAAVIDHSTISLREGLDGDVDLVINTAPTPFGELLAITRPGGRIVSATTLVDAENDRDVTAIRMASRSDASQLASLVAAIDAGDLHIWVGDRRPLADIAAIHEGPRHGKTIIVL